MASFVTFFNSRPLHGRAPRQRERLPRRPETTAIRPGRREQNEPNHVPKYLSILILVEMLGTSCSLLHTALIAYSAFRGLSDIRTVRSTLLLDGKYFCFPIDKGTFVR